MEFLMTMVFLIGLPAALLSGATVFPVYRLQKPYAKVMAVVVGVVLFLVFAWAAFVALIIWSARQGAPF